MSSSGRIGTVIVTHGNLGQELVAVARGIVGEAPHMEAVSTDWSDDAEAIKEKIEEAIGRVDGGKGVIILTDMFGGTPSNIAFSLLQPGRREIVTGVNLPMVVKLASQSEAQELGQLVTEICQRGQKQISSASELLEK